MNVRCASPTCSKFITTGDERIEAILKDLGWVIEQQPGDDRPRPYCQRCKL